MVEKAKQLLEQLEIPVVRDLAWCLLAPSLLDNSNASPHIFKLDLTSGIQQWLVKLDRHPKELEDWMEDCASPRLGLRFEHFWQFYWDHFATVDAESSSDQAHKQPPGDFLHNLQIHRQGLTLGELDVVHYDHCNALLHHQELTVKFYLGVTKEDAPQLPFTATREVLWLGPKANDRLDIKLSQLINKQLVMLTSGEHHELMPDSWKFNHCQASLIIKGRLFYPLKQPQLEDAQLNPNHERGVWLRFRQVRDGQLANLPLSGDERGVCYQILERKQWFAPLLHSANNGFDEHIDRANLQEQLQHHFNHCGRPLLVSALQLTKNNQYCELERFFVVHDQWPAIHD